MFPQKRQITAELDPKTYPLGEQIASASDGPAMALVALSHTPVERRLYAAMVRALESSLTDLPDSNLPSEVSSEIFTVRRGLEGLVAKSSAERVKKSNESGKVNGAERNESNGGTDHESANTTRDHGVSYRVRKPEDIIASQDQNGINTFTRGITNHSDNRSFERVIQRIVATKNLSRREAQVALCCVEGLTNAEIGLRLLVKEQTVKFHLRHVFLKFGVKRRAELISRLLL